MYSGNENTAIIYFDEEMNGKMVTQFISSVRQKRGEDHETFYYRVQKFVIAWNKKLPAEEKTKWDTAYNFYLVPTEKVN